MRRPFLASFFLAILLSGCRSEPLPLGVDDGGATTDDALGSVCQGLAESACKADPRCTPDYCSLCSCTPTFMGCRQKSDPPQTCPLVDCLSPACSCDGLDEAACTAAASSLGCTAVNCCGNYVGCFGPNAGAPACVADCVEHNCRRDQDCESGLICVAPSDPGGDSCTQDSDCYHCPNCPTCGVCAPSYCVMGSCHNELGRCIGLD